MDNPSSHSATYGPLTSRVFAIICEQLGLNRTDWSGPEIIADHSDYKLDWHNKSGGHITLYSDGVVSHYDDDAERGSTSVIPLHDRGWLDKLKVRDEMATIVLFAVEFFEELKQ